MPRPRAGAGTTAGTMMTIAAIPRAGDHRDAMTTGADMPARHAMMTTGAVPGATAMTTTAIAASRVGSAIAKAMPRPHAGAGITVVMTMMTAALRPAGGSQAGMMTMIDGMAGAIVADRDGGPDGPLSLPGRRSRLSWAKTGSADLRCAGEASPQQRASTSPFGTSCGSEISACSIASATRSSAASRP